MSLLIGFHDERRRLMFMRNKFFWAISSLLIAVCISLDANAQWKNDKVLLSSSIHNTQLKEDLQSCSTINGRTVFVWRERRAINGVNNYRIFAQCVDADGHVLWDPDGVLICESIGQQRLPKVIADCNSNNPGGALIMWLDSRSGINKLYAQRITACGSRQWNSDGKLVSNSASSFADTEADFTLVRHPSTQFNPIIAYVQGGELWCDQLNVENGERVQGYLVRICLPTCSKVKVASRGSLETHSYGTAFVTWKYEYTFEGGGTNGYPEIRAQKLTARENQPPAYLWKDTGSATDDDAVRVCGGDGQQCDNPLLIIHPGTQEHAIIAWERRFLSGGSWTSWRLEAFRTSGWNDMYMRWNVVWRTTNVGSDSQGASVNASMCLLDDNSTVALAYEHGGGIHFTHFGGVGVDAETFTYKLVLRDSGGSISPKILCGRNSTAIIGYRDSYKVFAQMISINRQHLWGAPDLPYEASFGTTPKTAHAIASDGSGGAVFGWIEASSQHNAFCNRAIPEIACTLTKSYVDALTGANTGKIYLSGCPAGDLDALRVDLQFNQAIMVSDISSGDITLDKPQGDISFWEIGPITAEQDANSGNGYCSNIVQKYISGCNVCGECGPSSVAVRVRGIRIGYVRELSINSVDMTNDGVVAITDLSMFSEYYPPKPYGACADFNADGSINMGDLGLLSFHYGPPGHAAPLGSTRLDASREAQDGGKEIRTKIAAPTGGREAQTSNIPVVSELYDSYPNPFNPATTIEYAIAADSYVDLSIFNVKGELVRNLVGEFKQKNRYSAVWDGKDSFGKPVGSGVYFYRLKAGDVVKSNKMVLLR
jgi:hypothetical protein